MLSAILLFLTGFTPALAADPLVCPGGIGSTKGEAPAIVVEAPSDWKVGVCGKMKNSFGVDVYSEFDIYATDDDEFEEKPMMTIPAANNYSLKKGKGRLLLSELALIDNEWLPLFNREIRCSAKGCFATRARCANQKLRHKPRPAKSVLDFYKKDAKRNSSTGSATDESEIALVFAAALAGDKDAVAAFEKNPGFRLDGASAAEYEYSQRTLKRLKSARCKL
jgi:hypothetical protein